MDVNGGRFPWPGSRPSDGNPGQSVCRCSPQSTDGITNVNGKEMAIHIRCKGLSMVQLIVALNNSVVNGNSNFNHSNVEPTDVDFM